LPSRLRHHPVVAEVAVYQETSVEEVEVAEEPNQRNLAEEVEAAEEERRSQKRT
jgi:hypothetical protein